MARAYSLDLRERVVAAVLHGLSCRAVAVRFDVSVASVVKWAQRARETGSPAARPMGWQAALSFGGPAQLAAGSSRREARSDVTYALKRTRRTRRDRVLRHPMALSAAGRF